MDHGPSELESLYAFYLEHRLCGELDGIRSRGVAGGEARASPRAGAAPADSAGGVVELDAGAVTAFWWLVP
jgi:hypothetical protein